MHSFLPKGLWVCCSLWGELVPRSIKTTSVACQDDSGSTKSDAARQCASFWEELGVTQVPDTVSSRWRSGGLPSVAWRPLRLLRFRKEYTWKRVSEYPLKPAVRAPSGRSAFTGVCAPCCCPSQTQTLRPLPSVCLRQAGHLAWRLGFLICNTFWQYFPCRVCVD